MINILPLKCIATVSAGYTFRGAIKPSTTRGILVIQAKDVSPVKYIEDPLNLTRTSLKIPRSNAYLKKDDVVISARGTGPGSFKATVFKSDAKNVVASASVFILRVSDKTIIPEYLALYLNSTAAQKKLFQNVSGTSIQIINRKALEELELSVPSLDRQNTLVKLDENIKSQIRLREQKSAISKKIMGAALEHVLAK